jgi:uncharacterized protein (DUF433 family)
MGHRYLPRVFVQETGGRVSPRSARWPWKALVRVEGVASGRPCVSETGVLIEVLFDMWLAGDSIVYLAEQYDLKPEVVEQAFREWAGRPRDWKKKVSVWRQR